MLLMCSGLKQVRCCHSFQAVSAQEMPEIFGHQKTLKNFPDKFHYKVVTKAGFLSILWSWPLLDYEEEGLWKQRGSYRRRQSSSQQSTAAARNEVSDEAINLLITQIRPHTSTQTFTHHFSAASLVPPQFSIFPY